MSPVTTRRRKQAQNQLEENASNIIKETEAKNDEGTALPVRAKDDEVSAPLAKGNLTVFGDDDEAEAVSIPLLKDNSKDNAVNVGEEEQQDDSDDDEAPEAVSTSKAALDVKKTAQAAQKAAQEQVAAQKRKRQQRDELFKHQAEERKKAEEKIKVEEAVAKSRQGDDTGDAIQPPSGRKRLEKPSIPALLPAEFLTDSSSEDEEDYDSVSIQARSKRRKVSGVERRISQQQSRTAAPKDAVVGSTVYRVARKSDERMAPKLKKYARSSKDLLLKRNRPEVKSRSSFLTRK